jgi:hypothetical protein
MWANRNPATEDLNHIVATRGRMTAERNAIAAARGSPYVKHEQNAVKEEVKATAGILDRFRKPNTEEWRKQGMFGAGALGYHGGDGESHIFDIPIPNYLDREVLANIDMLTDMNASENQYAAKLRETNLKITRAEGLLKTKQQEYDPLNEAINALQRYNQTVPEELTVRQANLKSDIDLLTEEIDGLSTEGANYHTILEKIRGNIKNVSGDIGVSGERVNNDRDIVPDWFKVAFGAGAMFAGLALLAGWRGKSKLPLSFKRKGSAYNVLMPGVR